MQVEAYLNGLLPRSDAALESGSNWLKGRETKENFHKILEKETLELIELQEKLGLDYIVEGQLFWHDFIRPIAQTLGLYVNGSADENPVTRQIYTNTFYRKPFIASRIQSAGAKIIDERFLNAITGGKRKVILPSPFALVCLSDGIHRNEDDTIKNSIFAELILDIAKILNNEIKRLEKSSRISFVQFNDPCFAYAKETGSLWKSIVESLNAATWGLKLTTSLHIYNGDISKFLPDIEDLPVNRIGFDAYLTNLKNFEGISFGKFLEIGIVNSKNSAIEEPQLLAKYAKQVIDNINPEGIALVPNRPLELVPQHIAIKKIESLAKARSLVK